jgi:predicted permease
MTQPNLHALGIDGTTLAFTIALSVATSVIFSLLPAWRASRPLLQDGLKESSSAGGGAGTRRLRNSLVVAEVALSTTLLVGAGLLVRSYQNLQQVSPGFNPDGVLTMAITLPDYKYDTPDKTRQFFEPVIERVARLPGVEDAALVNVLPFSTYDRGSRYVIDGKPRPDAGREPASDFRSVTPGYFRTLEIPVIAGRSFDERDRDGSAPVAMVNRAFAERFLDKEDPLGHRVRNAGAADAPWRTIVGVVGNVHHTQLTVEPEPELYVPFAQVPQSMMMLAARVTGTPESLAAAVRSAVQSVDPAQPVYHVKSLDRLLGESMAPQTMAASVVALFSGLALLLAGVGTYGVLSYAVSQQTREFGLRMALGASRGDLLHLVMRRGLRLVLGGVILGVAAALAVTRLMAGALYGVGAGDPVTYAGVAAALTLVGIAACVVPAWRATRIEPVTALRAD